MEISLQIPGALVSISVGADGAVWGINEQKQIFRFDGSGFSQIPGSLQDIAVGNGNTVWGLTSGSSGTGTGQQSIVFNWNPIVFQGDVPVGGWANLTVDPGGSYNFSGHFHDSGAVNFNVSTIFAIKSSRGAVFTFSISGKVNGTEGVITGGSRDFDWDNSGTNDALKANWDDLAGGWAGHADASASLSIPDLWNDLKAAVGAIAQVIAVVGPLLA